jgi:Flp pilus assembly protein TadG
MLKMTSQNKNRRKGQALVEFALALPLLVLILVGVLDLGRAFYALIAVHNAAREGARYASHYYPENTSVIVQIARAEASDVGIPGEDLTVVSESCGDSCVRVNVSYDFKPVLTFFLPETIQISRSVEMLIP